jgi:polyvinyl alcohol dehydrogenase (cytochrome)
LVSARRAVSTGHSIPTLGRSFGELRSDRGSPLGAIEWGTASDGRTIYAAIGNFNQVTYTLLSGQQINWGSWSALDAATGKILWQTADPVPGSFDIGSVSEANGVVYAELRR